MPRDVKQLGHTAASVRTWGPGGNLGGPSGTTLAQLVKPTGCLYWMSFQHFI